MNRSGGLEVRTLLLVSLVALALSSAARADFRAPVDDPNLVMGNPSAATNDPANRNNYLMERPFFAESFNDKNGTPNWVSWRLISSDIGHAPRVPFYADTQLPADFKHVDPTDYTGDGFDRGHMCDHGDRSSSVEASTATFTMANMIPQSPHVNQKAWAHLEEYCRQLAQQGKTLYVVSGPSGQGGTGSHGAMTIVGQAHQVVVPAKCWKVIMVLDHSAATPSADIQQVNASTRMIAVIMPNDVSVGDDWTGFRVPVADVEKLTGFKFFSSVPAAVIDPLKASADTTFVPPPAPFVRGTFISH